MRLAGVLDEFRLTFKNLERGQLIKLNNLDEIKKMAVVKKNGLNINGKWLKASGFVEGQEFTLGQKGKDAPSSLLG